MALAIFYLAVSQIIVLQEGEFEGLGCVHLGKQTEAGQREQCPRILQCAFAQTCPQSSFSLSQVSHSDARFGRSQAWSPTLAPFPLESQKVTGHFPRVQHAISLIFSSSFPH